MITETERALADIIASTTEPLRIVGGGTRPIGRPITARPLTTRELRGIRIYEPGALTLVVGAGEPLQAVQTLLAENGQCLPFEPVDYRGLLGTIGEPTIGAVAAANISGPRRVKNGACRDFMIGVRLIDGTGEVIGNGGRVMKNVTGYDLVKLVAGSLGCLGVVTEVAFKVLPKADCSASLIIHGLDDAVAISLLADALASPCEVTGAAHLHDDSGPMTAIRVEGFEESVTHRLARLKDIVGAGHDVLIDEDSESVRALWTAIGDARQFHAAKGDVWRWIIKPDQAPRLVESINRQIPVQAIYDWGGGLVWLCCPEGFDCRAAADRICGHATLVRATDATRLAIAPFPPESGRLAQLSDGIRRKFDPRGLLNPGLRA